MKNSRAIALVQGLLFILALASLSVHFVLCWNGFYAMNVDWYGLDAYIGVSKAQLVEAYHEVMAYCMGATSQFSAGIFSFSAEGEAHFVDVRNIFIMVGYLAKITPFAYIVLRVLQGRGKLTARRPFGRSPEFCAVVGMFILLAIIGVFAAIDFNRAFTVFHMIFFPGKTNWVFDWQTDPVILALPQEFFRNCAMLIGGLILSGCAVVVGFEFRQNKKHPVS